MVHDFETGGKHYEYKRPIKSSSVWKIFRFFEDTFCKALLWGNRLCSNTFGGYCISI